MCKTVFWHLNPSRCSQCEEIKQHILPATPQMMTSQPVQTCQVMGALSEGSHNALSSMQATFHLTAGKTHCATACREV